MERSAVPAQSCTYTPEPVVQPLPCAQDAECDVSIKNVVGTYSAGVTFNLALLAVCLKARYDASVFPAAVSYGEETNTSAQIFSSGQIVLVGAKTNEHVQFAAVLLSMAIYVLAGIECSVLNSKIRNWVCRIALSFRVNMDLFYADAASGMINMIDLRGKPPAFDKERFPGMSFAIRDALLRLRTTIAMFDTGKGVGTGIKSEQQIEQLRMFLQDTMYKYKLGSEYRQLDASQARTRRPTTRKTAIKRPRRTLTPAGILELRSN